MPHPRHLTGRLVPVCLACALVATAPPASAQRTSPRPAAAAAPAAAARAPGRTGSGPLRVLFVGNSYTYYNGLPDLVAQLAAIAGEPRPLRPAQVAVGGATLDGHVQSGAALRAIRSGGAGGAWDVVVLQEQSLRPLDAPDAMLRSVRALADVVSGTGARLILYETWARQAQPARQDSISAGYRRAAERSGAQVVPVGRLWSRLRPTVEAAGGTLYDADGSHPSALGSYVAAAAFYTALYGRPAPLVDSLAVPLQHDAAGSPTARRGLHVAPPIAAAVRTATAALPMAGPGEAAGAGAGAAARDSLPFPAAWAGRWTGDLEILAADGTLRSRVPMHLELGGTADAAGFPFRMTYGDPATAPVRDYRLRAVQGDTANAFVIDEQNGIVLDARRFGASLVSVFRVGDRMLQTTYAFAGDELRFEVLFWADAPRAPMRGAGENGERGLEVRSYVPSGRQVARLRRTR